MKKSLCKGSASKYLSYFLFTLLFLQITVTLRIDFSDGAQAKLLENDFFVRIALKVFNKIFA